MIRDKFYKDIASTIDKHNRFDSSDFKIESIKDGRNTHTTLTIKYNIESKYKVIFKIPTFKTPPKEDYGSSYYAFSGSVCPGPLAYEETFSFTGEEGVFERISIWLNCIWEELSASPIVKQVENQQQQIDEIFDKLENIKDEFFSDNEANDLRNRLDELEETLKNQILKSEEDKNVLQQDIAKLHTDIDTLKQTIQSFNKKGWLKSFTGKIFKWTKDADNRKMLKDGYSVIREFLPEEIKNTLPGGE